MIKSLSSKIQKRFLKLFLIIGFILFVSNSWGQAIISDSFENTTTLFSNTSGSPSYYSGNSAAGDRPATTAFAIDGTYGIGQSGGVASD